MIKNSSELERVTLFFPSNISRLQEGNDKKDSVALDLSLFSRVSLPNLAVSRIVVDCILDNVSDRDTIPLVSVVLRDISGSGNILQYPGRKIPCYWPQVSRFVFFWAEIDRSGKRKIRWTPNRFCILSVHHLAVKMLSKPSVEFAPSHVPDNPDFSNI